MNRELVIIGDFLMVILCISSLISGVILTIKTIKSDEFRDIKITKNLNVREKYQKRRFK